jgi:hypothetical protein
MSKKMFLALAVFLPMLIASTLYILFRNLDLVVFSLISKIHVLPFLMTLRGFVGTPFLHHSWIVFSLPGSLWMLSSMNLVLFIWQFKIQKQNLLWIFTPALFALLLEELQRQNLTDGTFDATDMLLYAIALVAFGAIYAGIQKNRTSNEPSKKQHLQSFIYVLCLTSMVYCSDKITGEATNTDPFDTDRAVHRNTNTHKPPQCFPASSIH